MLLQILSTAVALAANPFALIGYIGCGLAATTVWKALRYGVLWGLAVQVFVVSVGNAPLFDAGLPFQTALRLLGAIIITVGVHYLARALRRS